MKFWKVLCETTVFWRHVRRFSALSETSLCVETVSFFAHKLDPRQAILKRTCEESQGPFVSASHSFCVVTACCADRAGGQFQILGKDDLAFSALSHKLCDEKRGDDVPKVLTAFAGQSSARWTGHVFPLKF